MSEINYILFKVAWFPKGIRIGIDKPKERWADPDEKLSFDEYVLDSDLLWAGEKMGFVGDGEIIDLVPDEVMRPVSDRQSQRLRFEHNNVFGGWQDEDCDWYYLNEDVFVISMSSVPLLHVALYQCNGGQNYNFLETALEWEADAMNWAWVLHQDNSYNDDVKKVIRTAKEVLDDLHKSCYKRRRKKPFSRYYKDFVPSVLVTSFVMQYIYYESVPEVGMDGTEYSDPWWELKGRIKFEEIENA